MGASDSSDKPVLALRWLPLLRNFVSAGHLAVPSPTTGGLWAWEILTVPLPGRKSGAIPGTCHSIGRCCGAWDVRLGKHRRAGSREGTGPTNANASLVQPYSAVLASGSTRIPGPVVAESAALRMYLPFEAEGFTRTISSTMVL